MLYDPKIFIRDYGTPTKRFLAYWGGFDLNGVDAALKRHLIIHAENPVAGEEFVTLSGDMNSGADTLDLSGIGNDRLVLANEVAIRVFGPDVTLIYSIIEPITAGAFVVATSDIGLTRDLFSRTGTGAYELGGEDAALKRDLLLHVEAGSIALTGVDVEIELGIILAVDVGTFTVTDHAARLLRHYPILPTAGTFSISGKTAGLIADRHLAADAGTFTMNGNAIDVVTGMPIGLSGDMNDGDDSLLLTGDAQSGADFLTTSKDTE
jgi:hypothetical protein